MGTRSLTHVHNDKDTLLTIYRQYDGYPDGMGNDLAEFLKPFTVVNGFGLDMKAGTHANGMGCLAAQLVKHLKDEIGNVYIYPPDSKDCGEEYIYHIRPFKDGKVELEMREAGRDGVEGKLIFKGTPDKALKAIAKMK